MNLKISHFQKLCRLFGVAQIILFVYIHQIFSQININITSIKTIDISQFPMIEMDLQCIINNHAVGEIDDLDLANIQILEKDCICQIVNTNIIEKPPEIGLMVLLTRKFTNSDEMSRLSGMIGHKILNRVFLVNESQGFIRQQNNAGMNSLYDPVVSADNNQYLEKNLQDYFREQLKLKTNGDLIHFLIGDYSPVKSTHSLKTDLQNLLNEGGHWLAYLYREQPTDLFENMDPDLKNHIVFIKDFDDEVSDLTKSFDSMLNLFKLSYIKVSYSSRQSSLVDTLKTGTVIIPYKADSLRIPFSYHIASNQISEQYIKNIYLTIRQMEKVFQFSDALDTLWQAKQAVKSDSFPILYRNILESWSKQILKTNHFNEIPSWLAGAEKDWNFNSDNKEWNSQVKLPLMKKYLISIEQDPSKLDEQIAICEKIVKIDAGAKEYGQKIMRLKARHYIEQGSYWPAVQCYKISMEKYNDTAAEKDFYKNLNEAIREDFNQNNYSQLYTKAKEYDSFIKSDFELRYMSAKSCYATRQYSDAKQQYEWLLLNWKREQQLTSWDEVFTALQSIYIQTLEFDKSFDLIRQIYREKSGQEDMLSLAIAILRAKYLVPAVQIMPEFYQHCKGTEGLQHFFANYRLKSGNQSVSAVYYLDTNGSLLNQIKGANALPPPTIEEIHKINEYPAIISTDKKTHALINKIHSSLFVLQISPELSQQEKLLMQTIQKNKMDEKPWYELAVLEQKCTLPLLSELLTNLMGVDYSLNKNLNLDSYWQLLNKNDFINYLVFHDKTGKIINKVNFDLTKATYKQTDWQKSSVTQALFQQDITYNNAKVSDISNFIIINRIGFGALRIGFKL